MSNSKFSKVYIQSIIPVIEHLNKECQHRYYEYLSATANPEDPIDEPESCFEDSNYWRQVRWGGNQMLLADENNGMVNALSQNEIRLYNGQICDNPYIVTTNLVKIICFEHQIDYEKFENYRNYYNQILAKYGENSDEFKAIDWKENNFII